MDDTQTYAVFLYAKALESLGDAIKPYLREGKDGGAPHVLCNEIDTGGSLLEMTMNATTKDGAPVQMQLMLPTSMVQMIVSAHSDESFGFAPRAPVPAEELPPVAAPAGEAEEAPKPES